MDIEKKLWQEHSKAICLEIVNYIGGDQARFDLLFSCIAVQKKILSQRASWPLSYCIENHPNLLLKHIEAIPQVIRTSVHPGITRNVLRALTFIDPIPEEISGHIFDLAFKFLLSEKEPVAIRSLSSRLVVQIGGPIPELRQEIKEVLKELSNHEGPGMRASSKNGLAEIKKWEQKERDSS